MITCKLCGEAHELENIAIPNKRTPTGVCKPCNRARAIRSYNGLSEKPRNTPKACRVRENPQNYMFCNECETIFSFRGRGRPSTFRPYLVKAIRTSCPNCDSEDFDDFIGSKGEEILNARSRRS